MPVSAVSEMLLLLIVLLLSEKGMVSEIFDVVASDQYAEKKASPTPRTSVHHPVVFVNGSYGSHPL